MTQSALGNTVTETRGYNTDNTLASISWNKAIGDLTYTWDANKNKTGESIAGTMSGRSFTVPTSGYDKEDRLVNCDSSANSLDQSWSLSLVGDWDSVTTNGSTQNRTHGPTHELLTAGGQNVTTDVKGNITLLPSSLRSQASSLFWDFDNRMSSADNDNNGSVDVTYEFDALGRRVARQETGQTKEIYYQVGQQTFCDYDAGALPADPTYNHVWGSYIDVTVHRNRCRRGG